MLRLSALTTVFRIPRAAVPAVMSALIVGADVDPAWAKPDFSRSRITMSPPAPAEGDVVTFTLEVTNSGDQDAPFADVVFEMPLEAMFVSVDGFDEARVNTGDKVLGGSLTLAAGASRVFHVRMVIPRDAGGRVLTPDLTVKYLHQGVEFYGHEVYEIASRVAEGGFTVGRYRVTGAGLAVLVFLAAFPVLWLLIALLIPSGRVRDESGRTTRMAGSGTTAFALLLPIAFWAIFAVMAKRDWDSTHSWTETSCLITDSRLREQETSSTGSLSRTRTTSSRTYQPLLALRYLAAGDEVVSTGFQTGSHLRVGGRARAESNLAGWPVGETVPCWFNPADRGDVVVRNGFGGAYLFALLPLPVAAFGVYRTRALLRRR